MASSTFVFVLLFSLLAVIVTSVPRYKWKRDDLRRYHGFFEVNDGHASHDRSDDRGDESQESNRRDKYASGENSRDSNSREDSSDDFDNSRESNSREDRSYDFENSRESNSREDRSYDFDNSRESNSREDRSYDFDNSRESNSREDRSYDFDNSRESNSREDRSDDFDNSRESNSREDRSDDFDNSRESNSREDRSDDLDIGHRRGYRRYGRSPYYRYHDIEYERRSYGYGDHCYEVCGINAVCIKHKCQCRYGFTGNPRFACHAESTAFCSITNDPRLTTFGGERFSLDLIADVKTAEVTTDRRAKRKGECNLQVWTFFNRKEGKMYITELQVKLTISSGYKSTENIFKIITYIDRGAYVFDVQHFDGKCFKPFLYDSSDSPFVVTRSFIIRSVQLKFSRVLPGLLQVELHNCGIKFGVRPQNDKKPQIVPGFMIEVDKSFNPTFFPEDVPTIQICLSENKVDLPKKTNFKDDVDSLVLIALTNSEVEPPFNSTPSNLADLRATLNHCCDEDKLRFVNFYQSVLSKPHFVKAISGGVPGLSELVRFLSLVLKDICGLDAKGCNEAEDLICQRADKANVELLKPYCSHYQSNYSIKGRRDS